MMSLQNAAPEQEAYSLQELHSYLAQPRSAGTDVHVIFSYTF